jgi:ubiquinone/menaquinone biosynthesis C-methylase UbiE
LTNVEFCEGYAEALPLPDNFAEVVISNGVLNLTRDKAVTLGEWARLLKPGGRLYVGDVLSGRSLSPGELEDVSLWTG